MYYRDDERARAVDVIVDKRLEEELKRLQCQAEGIVNGVKNILRLKKYGVINLNARIGEYEMIGKGIDFLKYRYEKTVKGE